MTLLFVHMQIEVAKQTFDKNESYLYLAGGQLSYAQFWSTSAFLFNFSYSASSERNFAER